MQSRAKSWLQVRHVHTLSSDVAFVDAIAMICDQKDLTIENSISKIARNYGQ